MDITELRAVVSGAREGNLTRAAELLHVTQPAVSLQLFICTSNHMTLSDDDSKLLPFSERKIAAM